MSYAYVSKADALAAMADEVREINISKGWRNADGTPIASFLEYVALAHSELSEALEAWREHGLDDMTSPTVVVPDGDGTRTLIGKPEGVGSELADTLIRLIDMADAFGIDLGAEYRRKIEYNRTREFRHGKKRL